MQAKDGKGGREGKGGLESRSLARSIVEAIAHHLVDILRAGDAATGPLPRLPGKLRLPGVVGEQLLEPSGDFQVVKVVWNDCKAGRRANEKEKKEEKRGSASQPLPCAGTSE